MAAFALARIPGDDLELLDEISRGSEGIVYRARLRKTTPVACKVRFQFTVARLCCVVPLL